MAVRKKGAAGAFFIALAIAAAAFGWRPQTDTAASRCEPARIDEAAAVKMVVDGDTLELTDGRRVRLIGINTQELRHRDRGEEPLAREALEQLERQVAPGDTVGLEYDRQRRDRYGRLLAHVYRSDRTNVQAELLDAGYAFTLIVPPNLAHLGCYGKAEDSARADRRGIWRIPDFAPLRAVDLHRGDGGFKRVEGRITRVRERRNDIEIELDGKLLLLVEGRDLKYFGHADFSCWRDRTITVRGYVIARGRRLVMPLRHPEAVEDLN